MSVDAAPNLDADAVAPTPSPEPSTASTLSSDTAAPTPAAAVSSAAATAPALTASAPLSALLRQRLEDRGREKDAVARHATLAAEAADELERNVKACVGIELNSVVENHRHLEAAVRNLHAEAKDISKRAAHYREQYRALVGSISEIDSLAEWLQHSERFVSEAVANMAFVEKALTSDST